MGTTVGHEGRALTIGLVPWQEETHQLFPSFHSVPCEETGRWTSANPEVGTHRTMIPPAP